MHHLFRRRYLISLFYMMVITVGVAAWLGIPMEMAPELERPSASVSYNWGQTTPEVMEQEVTRRVEQAVQRLRDVESVESVTRAGRSTVSIDFHPEAPVDFRLVELREYLREFQGDLPEDLGEPNISRRVPQELSDMQTFLTFTVSGDRNPYELREFVEQNIRIPLMALDGISEITISGVEEPALIIDFDHGKVTQYNINRNRVMSEIRQNLDWRSAGYRDEGGFRYSIDVPPAFEHVDDILNHPIGLNESDRRITLDDIADVRIEDNPNVHQTYRLNASSAITLQFERQSGSDAMALAETVHEELEEIKAGFPDDIVVQLGQDSTRELREMLTELEFQAIISLLCVFIILLVFIRRLRAPFVILGSILFSILLSVSALYVMDFSMNVITLAGLTIALGMIIDNAVVVFEHLNPNLPAGRGPRIEHVRKYIKQVFVPVLGSTFTTVGIFVPVLFAMEEVRIYLMPLALALTLTLVASVIISLTWIPYALIWLVHPKTNGADRVAQKPWYRLLFRKLRRTGLLVFIWRYRLRWVIIPVMTLLIGIPLYAIPDPEFLDQEDEEELTWWQSGLSIYFDNRDEIEPWLGGLSYRFVNETHFGESWGRSFSEVLTVNITVPEGTSLEQIDEMARNFERIAEPYEPAMEYYETRINRHSGARLQFHFKDEYLMRPEPYRLKAEASFLAARTGNSRISVSGFGDGFSSGTLGGSWHSFRITLNGYSYDELEQLAKDLRDRLKQNQRVEEVDINQTGFGRRADLFQYVVEPDVDRLESKGMSRRGLFNALGMEVNPSNTFGRVDFQEQEMFLVGRTTTPGIYQEDLEHRFRYNDNTPFRLSEVASITQEQVMNQIRRENQSYSRVVSFDFLGPHRFGREFTEELLEEFPTPIGTSIEYGRGFSWGDDDTAANLLLIFGLALLSVWMIVSALLEKWIDPIVVLLAVPLSAIGVMYGTMFHGLDFDRSATAGALLAAGVVVNNAILLMHGKEYTRQLGISGLRSWMIVYRTKMRPVLITSLTTLGGLMPLVIFETSEFWNTLATVVCWGLASSTLFILLLMGLWERPFQLKRERK